MGLRTMSWAFQESEAIGSERLVMLSLADSANEEDGLAWPSIALLQRKTNLSESTVRRALQSLCDLGELRNLGRVKHSRMGAMRADRCPNVYEMTGYLRGINLTPRRPPRGVKTDPTGCQNSPSRGVTRDTRTIKEPEGNQDTDFEFLDSEPEPNDGPKIRPSDIIAALAEKKRFDGK